MKISANTSEAKPSAPCIPQRTLSRAAGPSSRSTQGVAQPKGTPFCPSRRVSPHDGPASHLRNPASLPLLQCQHRTDDGPKTF
eukprot:4199586-Alexandrium_andersonii.AAC.1